MKKYITLTIAALVAAIASGCASYTPKGALLTDISLPIALADANAKVDALKVGKSQCKDVLALIAQGDASIAAAMKNGNITKVHFVDWKANNILGLVGTYECTVYGE
ncbi:MAG: TRL-like protein family [Verrucomicrobia bacterium]|nr:TRL-like protein family [Verrucomicrobiota bacterium]MBR6798380.1 TRL-like family protein [Opitutales bacterium]